jgi:alginate O-acetyltransferase complex protein AlgI
VPRVVAVALTFLLVVIGWVLFRMHSAADIGGVYAGMLGLHGIGGAPGHLMLYLLVSAAIVWGLPEEWRWPVAAWGPVRVAAVAVLFVVSAASVYTSHPFIYFRF